MSRTRRPRSTSALTCWAIAALIATALVLVTAPPASAKSIAVKQHTSDDRSNVWGDTCAPGIARPVARRFDLLDDHDLVGPVAVKTISATINVLESQTTVRVGSATIFTIPAATSRTTWDMADATFIGTKTFSISDAEPGMRSIDVPMDPAVVDPAESDLVVELILPADTELVASGQPETQPAYIVGCDRVTLREFSSDWAALLWAEVEPTAWVNTAPPSITGTPQIGRQLTAVPGTWFPAPDSSDFQWHRDGIAIPGATGATYTPGPGDRGAVITVVETVSASDDRPPPASATGQPTAAVQRGEMTLITHARIVGTPRVGEVLTAEPGTFDPAPDEGEYVWFRGADSQGSGPTYTLTEDDLGKDIALVHYVRKDGYVGNSSAPLPVRIEPGVITATRAPRIVGNARARDRLALDVETDAVGPVERCVYALRGAPRVRGEAVVGGTLEATAGDWSPTPVAHGYQWLVDGEPVPGATGATYIVRPGDLDQRISVRVTASGDASADPCDDATATSDQTGRAGKGTLRSTTLPVVSGSPVVGERLTVDTGAWSVEPVDLSYQWTRGGAPIPGATGPTYVPTGADVGRWLAVTVTASAPGYADVRVSPAASALVAPGTGRNTAVPSVTGNARLGATLTATPGEWSFDPEHLTYQWLADGRRIAGASGQRLRLTAPGLRGRRISVRVIAGADGFADATAGSTPTKAVATGRAGLKLGFSTKRPKAGKTKVVIVATVTARPGLAVTGRVRVKVDGNLVGTRRLEGGAAQLTLPTLAEGRHTVAVVYPGSDALTRAVRTTKLRATP